jgi:hypothetical protein
MSNSTNEQTDELVAQRLDDAVAELKRIMNAVRDRSNETRVVEKKGKYGYSVYVRSAR